MVTEAQTTFYNFVVWKYTNLLFGTEVNSGTSIHDITYSHEQSCEGISVLSLVAEFNGSKPYRLANKLEKLEHSNLARS